MKKLVEISNSAIISTNNDLANSILRISFSLLMLFGHGWGKIMNFSSIAPHFPDPFGLGSFLSLALAVFAEFFCAILLALGLFTRLATIPLMITMLVAIFAIHINDPWGKIEFPLMYFLAFLSIFLSGPDKFTLDSKISKK